MEPSGWSHWWLMWSSSVVELGCLFSLEMAIIVQWERVVNWKFNLVIILIIFDLSSLVKLEKRVVVMANLRHSVETFRFIIISSFKNFVVRPLTLYRIFIPVYAPEPLPAPPCPAPFAPPAPPINWFARPAIAGSCIICCIWLTEIVS